MTREKHVSIRELRGEDREDRTERPLGIVPGDAGEPLAPDAETLALEVERSDVGRRPIARRSTDGQRRERELGIDTEATREDDAAVEASADSEAPVEQVH